MSDVAQRESHDVVDGAGFDADRLSRVKFTTETAVSTNLKATVPGRSNTRNNPMLFIPRSPTVLLVPRLTTRNLGSPSSSRSDSS